MRSEGGRARRILLAVVALVWGRRRRRRAERARERERLERQAEAVERLESQRGSFPGEPARPDRERARESERIEEMNEQIRRRRAEPPPAKERDTEPRPRLELGVAALLIAAALAAAGFVVVYVVFPDTQLLGLTLGGALALLAAAAAIAGKRLVPQEKASEAYHYFGDEERQEDVRAILAETGEGVSRRKLLTGAAAAAGLTLGAAAAVPVASLGPSVGERVYATPWRRGKRVVDAERRPILADDVEPGDFLTAFPEHSSTEELGSPILLSRFAADELELNPGRRDAAPGGIVAYSKICTHAGCAVSMYREPLFPRNDPRPAFVCPCHYSTFDPRRGGRVLFGPASRDLPQLPLRVNAAGELEADGDFLDPIGPSYGGSRLGPEQDVKP